jgi:hypothetical protein
MYKLIFIASLACAPGDRLVDLTGKFSADVKFLELLISIEPFYARLYFYPAGFPELSQQCCNNKFTSIVRVPIADGKLCIRQSQQSMNWKARAILNRGIEM